ncbi:CLUMA_CG011650, isoform A [Clunio marinus]|uniref:CLUMA_CG011650, isoform A n=1 Tax=Clunio marinus TaxID=568069 RepID=A0A1J1IDJ6_9DIPT|nr:CLUMA_CG011650, isoform A [Clunio marinus]
MFVPSKSTMKDLKEEIFLKRNSADFIHELFIILAIKLLKICFHSSDFELLLKKTFSMKIISSSEKASQEMTSHILNVHALKRDFPTENYSISAALLYLDSYIIYYNFTLNILTCSLQFPIKRSGLIKSKT